MRQSSYSLRSLLIIAAGLQLVWGLVPNASNLVIQEIPVELYITLRWTLSGVIFLFVLLFSKSSFKNIFQRETWKVSLLGIFGYAIASFGFLYGLKLGGVTNFALMCALSPVISSMASIAILKERPKKLFFVALPLCVAGLVSLVLGKQDLSSWNLALSSGVLILSGICLEALVFVFSKKTKAHFTSTQYLAISQVSASLFMWILQAAWWQQTNQLDQLSAKGITAALFVSIVACVLCYSVLYWLLNYLDGHRLALFDGLHTISATLCGYLLFNETLNSSMLIGGLLILSGLTIGNLPDHIANPSSAIPVE